MPSPPVGSTIEQTDSGTGEPGSVAHRKRPAGRAADPAETQHLGLPGIGDRLEDRRAAARLSARRVRRPEDAVVIALVHPRGRPARAAASIDLRLNEVPDGNAVDLEASAVAVLEGHRMPSATDVGHDAEAVGVARATALNREIRIARARERGGGEPLAPPKWASHKALQAPGTAGPAKDAKARLHGV